MTRLTIGRMAKLYGLHRSTLHEAVAKGKISVSIDSKNQRLIDLSEMIRVYGEPASKGSAPYTKPYTSLDSPPTLPTPAVFCELLEEIRALRLEVNELKQALYLLEHKKLQDEDNRVVAPAPLTFGDILKNL